MSKSLWSRSVWNSLFSRSTSRRRRLQPKTWITNVAAAESLEERVVPVVSATFTAGTLALVGEAADNEVVTVRAGSAYTDVLVGGKFTARLNAATSNSITSVTFNGGASAADALVITGVNQGITVDLTDVEKLTLSTRDTTVTSNEALVLGASTVTGTLTITPTGDLTQVGKVIVSGDTTINNAGNAITLTTSGNSFGTLKLQGAAVTINESGATDLGTSTITGGLTLTSRGAITDSGVLAVSGGNTTLTSVGNSITLDVSTSTFTNNFVLSGTDIAVTDNTAVVLGKTTATGTLSVTSALAAATITQTGAIKVGGLATFTTSGGNVDLDETAHVNNFGSIAVAAGAGTIDIRERSATDLSDTTGSTLTVTSSGAITDSGVLTISGATGLTSTGRAITLDEGTSTFGALSLSGSNVAIVDNNATALTTVTATGTFDLTSGGAITQTGTISVIGRATITAAAGSDITINTGTVNFGSLALSGDDATIDEDSATDLFTSALTGGLLLSTAGHVTDSGDLTIGGTTSVTATGTNKSITLDSAGSELTGAITLSAPKNVSLTNVLASALTAVTATSGTFTLISGGVVTQTGVITVANGRTTIDATGYDITLNSANNFSSVALDGEDIQITDANAVDLFTTNATGALTVASTGAITDSGTINVVGITTLGAGSGNAVTLDSAASTFGGNLVLNTSGAVSIRDNDAGGATFSGGTLASLSLTAGGDISNSAAITVTGNTTLNAGTGNITLTNAATIGGSLSLTGDDATVTDAAGVDLGTTSLTGELSVTAGGAISDSGNVVVAGLTTFSAAAFAVELNSSGNSFGTLLLTGAAVTIVEAAATNIGTSAVSGNLSVTSSGAITDSGVITASGATVTVTVTATGNNITLDQLVISDDTSTLISTGADVVLNDTGATILGATTATGSFSLTTTGAVTQSGTATVGGLASITNGGAAAVVTLNNANNSFGSVGVIAGADVTIVEKNSTVLAATTITTAGSDLSVTSGGAVTDSGNVSVVGTTTIATPSGAAAITLDQTGNSFTGALILSGSNIAVTNSIATDFGATTALGTLSLVSGGAVSDSGVVTVGGAATITATGFAIDLNSANNYGSIGVAGTNVVLTESSATDLAASTVTGTFQLTSAGNVTDSGTLTFTGATTTIAAGAGFDITLDQASSVFGTLALSGEDIAVTEDAASDLGIIGATGTLTITANGAVTDSSTSVMTVAGQVTINAGLFGITLDRGAANRIGNGFNVLLPLYIGNPVAIS